MGDFGFFVQVGKERPQAFDGFDELVFENFVAINHHLDKAYRQIDHFDVKQAINLYGLSSTIIEYVIQQCFVNLAAKTEHQLLHLWESVDTAGKQYDCLHQLNDKLLY